MGRRKKRPKGNRKRQIIGATIAGVSLASLAASVGGKAVRLSKMKAEHSAYRKALNNFMPNNAAKTKARRTGQSYTARARQMRKLTGKNPIISDPNRWEAVHKLTDDVRGKRGNKKIRRELRASKVRAITGGLPSREGRVMTVPQRKALIKLGWDRSTNTFAPGTSPKAKKIANKIMKSVGRFSMYLA